MNQYAITFIDELANFFTVVVADDEWQARRKAEIFFWDTYGLDVGMRRWLDVEIKLEGVYA